MLHNSKNNPELVFILKHLEVINKPSSNSLRYDYEGDNSIIVKEEYYIRNSQTPYIVYFTNTDFKGTHYYFNKTGQLDYMLIDYTEVPTNKQVTLPFKFY